jgi:hypothetical protein
MDEARGARVDLEEIRNPDTEFETSDLPVPVIGLAALGLTLLLGISPIVLLYGFRGVGADVNRTLRVLPPQPRLQINPSTDLQHELSHQRAVLGSYGWVDRTREIARVPVTVAMQELASAGIEGFPRAPAQASSPSRDRP